jgi:subtilisin family serine protease
VINASLGSPVNDLSLAAAAQYAWLHGVLVVAAAGNESSPSPDYPAVLPNVVSVSASDQNDRLYGFSNSGARVAAPGENSTTGLGGTYVSFLGTSSAAPVVSGIAALAFSLVPSATPGQVEQAIEASAVPIPGVASVRVDAYGTLQALAPGLVPTETAAPSQAQPQGGASGTGTSVGAQRTKVVTGRIARGRTASVVLVTGAGLLRATAKARTGSRTAIRLRLVAAGRVAASARGVGRASLRAQVRARGYRLVVSTSSRRPLTFAVTISYPAGA